MHIYTLHQYTDIFNITFTITLTKLVLCRVAGRTSYLSEIMF